MVGVLLNENTGFAKLYTDKTAVTAADFLNDKVLPFFDSHNLPLLRILTDRGTAYCGAIENHPYSSSCISMALTIAGPRHSILKPTTVPRNLTRPCLYKFYQVAFRKKVYTSLEDIQDDMDKFLHTYNTKRNIYME